MIQSITIRPARGVTGSLVLPGDKSISHRYAMLAAISEGISHLENYSPGADCASTLSCLETLGVRCERKANSVTIQGLGPQLKAPASALDCGNSGSTIRMLSGILAGQEFTSQLIGDDSLSRRPMKRIIEPLFQMGARISSSEGDRPPLSIRGAKLKGIQYKPPVASAQVKTCLLFAGLFAEGNTSVDEPTRTRDHGEIALRAFGAQVIQDGIRVSIKGLQKLHALDATIPGDLSSASFFLCAAALFPESRIEIRKLLMNPTRARLLDVLIGMGVRISVTELQEIHGELVGSVTVEGGGLAGGLIAGTDTTALIDEIPVLAAIAPYTSEGIEIRDAGELRVKESDRIATIASNLRAMGTRFEEREDGLRIAGGQRLRGAELDSFGDHRIAMAFAVAALRAEGESVIKGADAAVISFPGFFDLLESVAPR